MELDTSQPSIGQDSERMLNYRKRVDMFSGVLDQDRDEMLIYGSVTIDEVSLVELLEIRKDFFFAVFACMDKDYLTTMMSEFSESLKSKIREGIRPVLKKIGALVDVKPPEDIEVRVLVLDSATKEAYYQDWIRGFTDVEWLLVPDPDPRHKVFVQTYGLLPESLKRKCPRINHLERCSGFYEEAAYAQTLSLRPGKRSTKHTYLSPWSEFYDRQMDARHGIIEKFGDQKNALTGKALQLGTVPVDNGQEPFGNNFQELFSLAIRKVELKSYGIPEDSEYSEYLFERLCGLCDLPFSDLISVLNVFHEVVSLDSGVQIYNALDKLRDDATCSALVWLLEGCIDYELFDEFYSAQSVDQRYITDVYLDGRFWLHLFICSPDDVRKSVLEILRLHQKGTLGKMQKVCGSNTHSRFIHFFNRWVSLYYVTYYEFDHPEDMKVRCLKEWEGRDPWSLMPHDASLIEPIKKERRQTKEKT